MYRMVTVADGLEVCSVLTGEVGVMRVTMAAALQISLWRITVTSFSDDGGCIVTETLE